jgi:hypothetical protein
MPASTINRRRMSADWKKALRLMYVLVLASIVIHLANNTIDKY